MAELGEAIRRLEPSGQYQVRKVTIKLGEIVPPALDSQVAEMNRVLTEIDRQAQAQESFRKVLGEITGWLEPMVAWQTSRVSQIQRELGAVNTTKMAGSVEADIRQFIRELEEKKSFLGPKVIEAERLYDGLEPSQKAQFFQAKRAIDPVCDKFNQLLGGQVGEAERWLVELEEQIHAQKGAPVLGQESIVSKNQQAATDRSEERTIDEILHELNSLIGLDAVKKDLAELVNFLKVQQLRKSKGMPTTDISLHSVFYGNPGTGKTTVARLLSGIYKSMNMLSQGHLVETDRAGLVAGYVGQTALKVTEVVNKALGGGTFHR